MSDRISESMSHHSRADPAESSSARPAASSCLWRWPAACRPRPGSRRSPTACRRVRADSASICATTCSQPSATTRTAPTFGCWQYAASVSCVTCMSGPSWPQPARCGSADRAGDGRGDAFGHDRRADDGGHDEDVIAHADAAVGTPEAVEARSAGHDRFSGASARRRDPRGRARWRRCACARARPARYRRVAVPIGLPYLITGSPARDRVNAILWPPAIALAHDDRPPVDVDRRARCERVERRRDVVARADDERPVVHWFTPLARNPPSTASNCPVTKLDASDARNTAAPTSSSTRPKRFIGVRIRNSCPRPDVSSSRFRSVSEHAGRDGIDGDAVRRPLDGERAREAGHAALLAVYAATSCSPTNDASDAMVMMRPRCRSTIGAPNTWQARSTPVRLVSMMRCQSSSRHLQRRHALGDAAAATRMSTRAKLSQARVAKRRRATRHRRHRPRISAVRRPSAAISAATVLDQIASPAGGDDVGAGRRRDRARARGRCRWCRRRRRRRGP